MAPAINRTAVFLELAAFLGVSAFCIATQPPLLQQDILKRCQDALLVRHLPIRGLSVDGRDVVLTGSPDSPILSPQALQAVNSVPGVRSVKTVSSGNAEPRTPSDDPTAPASVEPPSALTPATAAQQQDVQLKIDRLLAAESINFKPDTAVLTVESSLVLDKIVSYLTEAPSLSCEIRGYDSQPREYRQNWVLALQRALATEDYLESKGIAAWRLSTHAFQVGQETAGRPSDRIVDFVVRAR